MEKKIRVQLIGKVSGLDRAMVVLDFREMQAQLEAQGYEVVNPLLIVPEDSSWHNAMRICIASLLTVDAVALVPNDWYMSQGALAEYEVAHALGLEILI